TFAVWMGTTMACAQCHHHKYDPFSQRDYYQVFAMFNNTDDFNTDEPVQEMARVGYDSEYAQLKIELAAAQGRWDEQTKARDPAHAEWEQSAASSASAKGPPGSTADESNPAAAPPKEIVEILAVAGDKRDKRQQEKLQAYHRGLSSEWKAIDD